MTYPPPKLNNKKILISSIEELKEELILIDSLSVCEAGILTKIKNELIHQLNDKLNEFYNEISKTSENSILSKK